MANRKTKQQLAAEQIVASLLEDLTPEEVYIKAHKYADNYRYIIAQRVTVAILLCTLWDYYEDIDEDMLRDFYNQYMAYYDSFEKKQENIYKQMTAINDMVGGDLLTHPIFSVVKKLGEEDEE